MAVSKKNSDPEGFLRLGDAIWFVKPDDGVQAIDKSHPTLILLFGWMDARPAHVAKFSTGYRNLYPNTPQIVVGSNGQMFFRSQASSAQRMKPILDHLIALKVLGEHAEPHRILTHTMSNGGCTQLDHLARLLALPSNSKYAPISKQPSAIVIDSSPGGDTLKSAAVVFKTTVPSPLVRYPFLGLLFTFHIIRYLCGWVPWRFLEPLRLAILNPHWLPWLTDAGTQLSKTPYLFIYSKADNTVPFKDIQTFTERAQSSGILVNREVYEDTAHVSHMRADPTRYWTAISKHWKKAMGEQ